MPLLIELLIYFFIKWFPILIAFVSILALAAKIFSKHTKHIPKKKALVFPFVFLIIAFIFYILSKLTYNDWRAILYTLGCGVFGALFIFYFLKIIARKEEINNSDEIEILDINEKTQNLEEKNTKDESINKINTTIIKHTIKKRF